MCVDNDDHLKANGEYSFLNTLPGDSYLPAPGLASFRQAAALM